MYTVPVLNFWLVLVAAFLLGVVIYDLVVTLFLSDRASHVLTARRNFPTRLMVYGCLAVIGAGIWMFFENWIIGLILVVGAIFAIVGAIWFNATHPDVQTSQGG